MARRARDDADDQSLALRARTDPDAFAQLYRRYVARVHAFAARRSGSREVADDVTAATFEKAWRAMPDFEWRGGGFEAWLFRIASTELATWYRREARARRPRAQPSLQSLSGVEPRPADDVADASEHTRIRAALSRLPDRYQQAIVLRYLSGLSNEEAAAAMGCSRSVMAVTLHRALTALRREIGRETQRGPGR